MLYRGGRVVAVLDWDRLGAHAFARELVRTAVVQFADEDGTGSHAALDLERIAAFTHAHRAAAPQPLPREAITEAVDRWWWKQLSGFWILDFHYERGDRSADALLEPSERLITWWNAHRAEVHDAFRY